MPDITWDASQPTWDSGQVTWDGWQAVGVGTLRLSVLHQTHDLSDVVTLAGATAYLLIYSGTIPINPGTAASGTLLASLPCSNPIGSVASGVLSFSAITPAAVANAGTAGYFRLCTSSAGTTCVAQGLIGTGAADLNFLAGVVWPVGLIITIPRFIIITNDAVYDSGQGTAVGAAESSDVIAASGTAVPPLAAGTATITEAHDTPAGTGAATSSGIGTAAIVEGHDVTVASNLTFPTQVQLLLQGQTAQNKATDSGGPINRFQPQSPDYTMIGWLSVPSATSYNIYRAVIPVGSQATGLTYTLYDSITSSLASTAYSSYVSGSGSAPVQTAVDSAYGDTAATGCVNGTRGNGTGTTPTPGDCWAATGYSYKVSAIVSGVESAQSAAHFGVYIGNGLRMLHLNSFNNEPNTAATNGGTTPNGSTLTTDWSETAQGYMNPYSGNGATEWNLNIRQWNYMEVWAKASIAGASVNIVGENETDLIISPAATWNSYATWVPGQYVHFKIPLADFWTDATRGRQNAWYKVVVSKTGGTAQEIWLDNWILTT